MTPEGLSEGRLCRAILPSDFLHTARRLAPAPACCHDGGMAITHTDLVVGKSYAVTSPNDCTVTDGDGVQVCEVKAGTQGFFVAQTTEATLSDNNARLTLVFKGAPVLGGNGSGGYIESDLNVGHGASAAVAAVCTLTLGDPTAEGDLTDNAEHALHLDAQPALQSHGVLTVADATESGTLSIGGEVVENFVEEKETPASISLALVSGYATFGQFEFGVKYQGEGLYGFAWLDPPEEATPADLETALNDADNWNENGSPMAEAPFEATWDSAEEKMTLTAIAKSGEDGDDLTYVGYAMTPFDDPADPSFSGGQDARTMEEAVNMVSNAINTAAGESVEAIADYENNAVNVTALEAGAAGDLLAFSVTGDLLEVTRQMQGGQDARTLDEVAAAITAAGSDFADEVVVSHASGASTLTLTAATAGKAANAIVYTSTGCFGGGTVKQGSTTRGKDAVTQTDYEIVLNGGAPQPLDLTSTEPLKNGHVYTLAVTADTDLSALTVKQYATCELWLDYTAGSVTWPEGLWWADGSAPTLAAGKSYAIALRNDGVKLRANVQYADTTPTQS